MNNNLKEIVEKKIFDLFFIQKEVDPNILQNALQDEDVLNFKKNNINDYLNICLFKNFLYVKNNINKGKYINYQKIQTLIQNENIQNIDLNTESLINLYEIVSDTNNVIMLELKNYLKNQTLDKLFSLLNNESLNNKQVNININKSIVNKINDVSFEEVIKNIKSLKQDNQKLLYKRLITTKNKHQFEIYKHIWNEASEHDKKEFVEHIFFERKCEIDFINTNEIKPYINKIILNISHFNLSNLGGAMTSGKLELLINECMELNNQKSDNFLKDLQHVLLLKHNMYEELLDYKNKYFDKLPNELLYITVKRGFKTLKKAKAECLSNKVLEIAKKNNYIDKLIDDLMNVNYKPEDTKQIYNPDYSSKSNIEANSPTNIWVKKSFKNYLDESLTTTNKPSQRRKL